MIKNLMYRLVQALTSYIDFNHFMASFYNSLL